MPEEETVQERHDGRVRRRGSRLTAATMLNDGVDETGLARRSLLQRALGCAGGALGAAAVVPLVGGLIKKPTRTTSCSHTGWIPNRACG